MGEKIFPKVYSCDGSNSVGGGHVSTTGDSINAMRSKVIALETELEIARVSGVVCGCMFVCVHVYMCVYTTSTLSNLCMCVCVSPPNFLRLFLFSCCIF